MYEALDYKTYRRTTWSGLGDNGALLRSLSLSGNPMATLEAAKMLESPKSKPKSLEELTRPMREGEMGRMMKPIINELMEMD